MYISKKKILSCVCLCAALAIYNDSICSIGRILYTEDELEKMKNDFGSISRLHRLIYVHIPKTGGSTMENSELMEDAVIDWKAGLRRPIWGHHPIFSMKNNAKERGIDEFHTAATIRHPCSRFISAFRYLKSDICSDIDKKYREEFGIMPDTTLDEYVQYLEDSHWENLYMHFIPQYQHVVNQNMTKVDVDNILCNEQWDEGVSRLKSVLGIEEMDTRRLYDHRGLGSTTDHVLQNKHETCQDLKPETRVAIERFYAMDYCLFGYDTMPPDEEGVCIGTENNGESMTMQLQDCKERLAISPQNLTKVFDFFPNRCCKEYLIL